jgi:hypothetical protein
VKDEAEPGVRDGSGSELDADDRSISRFRRVNSCVVNSRSGNGTTNRGRGHPAHVRAATASADSVTATAMQTNQRTGGLHGEGGAV